MTFITHGQSPGLTLRLTYFFIGPFWRLELPKALAACVVRGQCAQWREPAVECGGSATCLCCLLSRLRLFLGERQVQGPSPKQMLFFLLGHGLASPLPPPVYGWEQGKEPLSFPCPALPHCQHLWLVLVIFSQSSPPALPFLPCSPGPDPLLPLTSTHRKTWTRLTDAWVRTQFMVVSHHVGWLWLPSLSQAPIVFPPGSFLSP